MTNHFATQTVTDLGMLKKKAVGGVFFLAFRRIAVQVLLTGGSIILARLLLPQVFGAFAIALGIVNLFGIFASLGLEPALVQKKENPKKAEMRGAFTSTLFLSSIVAVVVIILAPWIYSFYQIQLGSEGILYLRLLSFSLLLLGLRGVSALLLERKLDYFRLTIVEVSEMLILQLTTIVLALKGLGVLSFIWGLLISRLLASIIFFILSPWPIGLSFSFAGVKKILPFGVNFQLSNIIGGLNAAIVPIFVGKVVGSAGVGLLNWAGGLAVFPRFPQEIIGRLIFPVGSRVQDDKRILRLIIEKSTQLSCLASFPLIVGLVALAQPVTALIYTDKWIPGIPALYFFSIQSIFIILGGVLMQVLLSIGEAKAVRNISLFWMIFQWVLTVPLVLKFGFTGLAMAGMLVSATFFIPLMSLKKKVEFEIGSHVVPYLIYSLIAGGIAYLINFYFPAQRILDLFIIIGIGGLVYLGLILVFKREQIIEDVLKVRKIVLSK